MNFIYLKSSDSLEVFPSNVLSDFNVRLPETLELEGDWELALLEIQYPNSWPKQIIDLKVYCRMRCTLKDGQEFEEEHQFRIKITGKTTINSIIVDFNKKSPFMTLSRDDDTNKLILTKNDDSAICKYLRTNCQGLMDAFQSQCQTEILETTNLAFIMSKELSQILGFVKNKKYDNITKLEASVTPFIPIHPSAIYVLCDLVETQLMGEHYQPILRAIPVSHFRDSLDVQKVFQKDKIHSQIFNMPYFKRLKRSSFSTIRIRLVDEYEQPIKFEGGVVIVVLGFRKRPFI